jgi:hypothetical protein
LELKGTPFVQALLPLDFSKKRTRLLQEIDLWLQQSENKARFDKHELKTETGTAKQAIQLGAIAKFMRVTSP